MKIKMVMLSFLAINTNCFSQLVQFTKSKVDYKFSFENLSQHTEANLGFIGIGADLYIFDEAPNLYANISSFSAITGVRPGLITLGMGLGYSRKVSSTPLGFDLGFFLGGGGGGGADDGGGLITRSHLNLKYDFKYFSIFSGVSRLDFPTGSIGNTNFNFGISLPSFFNFGHSMNKNVDIYDTTFTKFHSYRFGILGTNYLNFQKGPLAPNNSKKVKSFNLIGFEFDKFITDKFYGTLKLNGAFTGGVDGYMSLLVGVGLEQPVIKNALSVDVQLVGGPSGGGGIDSGGGATFQGNFGVRANLSKNMQYKISLGRTLVTKGNLSGNYLEFNISKKLNFIEPEHMIYQLSNTDKIQRFGFEILNRTYFCNSKKDKNNKTYDPFFNLVGFQFSKNVTSKLEMLASTFWAYQGSYGAYAEGWFGLQYKFRLNDSFFIHPKLGLGAAGGGGINLGNGLVYEYNLGCTKELNNKFSLGLNLGKISGFKGNFNPFLVDLALKYSFEQIIN